MILFGLTACKTVVPELAITSQEHRSFMTNPNPGVTTVSRAAEPGQKQQVG